MKRKMTRKEAFVTARTLAESKVKFVKMEDVEEGEVYAVVTPTIDDPTVTFKDGDLLIGPFSSEEEAQAAIGDDVTLVSGDADGGPVTDIGLDDVLATEPKTESKIRSNLMRLRRRAIESTRAAVRRAIMREAVALDVDTDVKSGDASTENGAGATNLSNLATFVNDHDTGSTDTTAGAAADQSASAENSDDNLIEARVGALVNVYETKTGRKVDTGTIARAKNGSVALESGESYSPAKYRFQVLAM